ncbi:MAG: ethylbenzene dehydrogenase-related protein, partial [Pseudolabrys sp.]
MRNAISHVAMIGLALGFVGPALAIEPQSINWSKIPTKEIRLFYPGLSTYDWLLSPAHAGAKMVGQGQACLTCHKGSEKTRGEKIVKGGDLEPAPIPGKNGTIEVKVQAAHDAEYVYFRFQWKSHLKREGRMHDYVRFDGKQWKWYGHDRNDKAVRAGEQPALYEDRFSIMLDDGKVPLFAQQGCWLTCHNGMRDTRNQVVGEPVKKHPLFADAKYDADIRKYLASTRTDDAASWDKTKSKEEIAKLKAEGGFLDLMQWRVNRYAPVGMADDGYVLEYRNFDEGKTPFSWNIDRKTMTPLNMFDATKVGA